MSYIDVVTLFCKVDLWF